MRKSRRSAAWSLCGCWEWDKPLRPRSNLIRFATGFFLDPRKKYAGQVDASHDSRAEMFGRQVMSDVPNDALVFVKGDKAVFTVWYFHFALNQRADLVLVTEDFLHFDWYQEVVHDTYPLLDIPKPFPWPETIANANPDRAVCYVEDIDQAKIDCRERIR